MASPELALIGWDVGGAHLKAAAIDREGRAVAAEQWVCPLWEGLPRLLGALDRAQARFGDAARHAATMSGEMADLFTDRADGVSRIAQTLRERFAPRPVRIFAGVRGFVDASAARGCAADVASANWRATAALVAARVRDALLIDIGTTTTDIVPIGGGKVLAQGHDDASRLVAGELVYSGTVRTPLIAFGPAAPCGGAWIPLIPESFATMADVYRLTGELDESVDQHPAADRGPKTAEASARRIARMVGMDAASGSLPRWRELAGWFRERQLEAIGQGIAAVLSRTPVASEAPLVAAGCGAFLVAHIARRMQRPLADFAPLVGALPVGAAAAAQCAAALAVGLLAFEAEGVA